MRDVFSGEKHGEIGHSIGDKKRGDFEQWVDPLKQMEKYQTDEVQYGFGISRPCLT